MESMSDHSILEIIEREASNLHELVLNCLMELEKMASVSPTQMMVFPEEMELPQSTPDLPPYLTPPFGAYSPSSSTSTLLQMERSLSPVSSYTSPSMVTSTPSTSPIKVYDVTEKRYLRIPKRTLSPQSPEYITVYDAADKQYYKILKFIDIEDTSKENMSR